MKNSVIVCLLALGSVTIATGRPMCVGFWGVSMCDEDVEEASQTIHRAVVNVHKDKAKELLLQASRSEGSHFACSTFCTTAAALTFTAYMGLLSSSTCPQICDDLLEELEIAAIGDLNSKS